MCKRKLILEYLSNIKDDFNRELIFSYIKSHNINYVYFFRDIVWINPYSNSSVYQPQYILQLLHIKILLQFLLKLPLCIVKDYDALKYNTVKISIFVVFLLGKGEIKNS